MRRLLIDTDCGTDDACAILLAVRAAQKETDLRIEAITTCNGNVPLAKVRPNVLRVLKLCDATEIPVFEGVGRPLVEPYKERRVHLHGNDGFGGISDLYPAAEIQVPEEHAANAMVRLAREFKDELSVVALGPLTNVALAQKLDPKFFSNIKELFVLGGSIVGSGKEPPGPGFNFTCDPEAVSIVVNESEKAEKLTIVSMEACRNYPLEWTWFESLDKSNKYVEFFKKIMGNAEKHWRALAHPGICIYDMTAIAVYLDQRVVAKTLVCPIHVDLKDGKYRGAIVPDVANQSDKEENARICSDLDAELLKSTCDRFV